MKISKQLYVTAKTETEIEWLKDENNIHMRDINGYFINRVVNKFLFGFLHPHEPNVKSDAKRKQTQREWAYGRGGFHKIEDGVVRSFETEWIDKVKSLKEMHVDFQPVVWDNDPMDGFRIIESVSRYSTSNKLWRIADPRGLVFEITTVCLEKIILNGSINKGLIEGECIWAANKNLVLCSTL